MKPQMMCFTLILSSLLNTTAIAQFGGIRPPKIPDIKRELSKTEKSLREAIEKGRSEKENEDAKRRADAERRQRELEASQKAIQKRKEDEEKKIRQLEIEQLRKNADSYLTTISKLETEVQDLKSQLLAERVDVAVKERELKNAEEVLTIKAEQVRLQELLVEIAEKTNKEAQSTVWKWTYGAIGTGFLAIVGLLGAFRQWLEIVELRKKLASPSKKEGGVTNPRTEASEGAY